MFPAIILAGGLGQRLRPLTNKTPKPLLKIKGKPILEHLLDILSYYGLKEIIISLGYQGEKIKNYFKDQPRKNLKISYVFENKPLGTGGAVKLAAKNIKKPFFLLWGDNLLDLNFKKMFEVYHQEKNLVLMALTKREDVENFGVAKLKGNKIIKFIEKPSRENAPSHLINAGVFIIHPRVLKLLPPGKSSLEKDCFEKLSPSGKISAYLHSGQWYPTDTLEKYYLAQKKFIPLNLKQLSRTDFKE